MKKILSIILSALLLLSTLPAFAEETASSANDYDYFLEAQELLTGLGCQDVTSKKDNIITRDDWLNLATEFSYYENVSRINLAGAGIHSDTNYYFLPDNPVKIKDAVIMLVKLLGYQPGVEYADSVYLNVASRLGIDDGVNASFDGYVTNESAYILLYNYLRANTAEFSVTNTDINIKTGDTNILYNKYNIVEVNAQVTESPGYSLTAESGTDSGFIKLDTKLCRNPRYDGDKYFGRYVTAYVKNFDSASGEVVAMYTQDKSKVTVINSEDCISYSDETLTYYADGDKEKNVSISLYADVFQNGERFSFAESLIPQKGTVTVINNSVYGDGADVVIIDKTVDVKLSSVVPADGTAFSADKQGDKLIINDDVSLVAPDGEPFEFENLTSGDVLTVWYKGDGSIWKAVWNNYSFTEVISEVSTDAILIAGKEYPFSESRYDFFKDAIKPGANVTVLINIYGEICDISAAAAVDGNPGIILALANVKKDLEQSLSMKLYTPSDGIAVFSVSDKVAVNGKRYKTLDEIDSAFEKIAGTANEIQKFVVYKLDEAKTTITSIDFASEIPMDVEGDSKVYLTKAVDETDNTTGKYRRWTKLFGVDIVVEPSSTTLFRIPKQAEDGSVDDNPDLYTNSKFSAISSGTTYSGCKVRGYSLDPKSKVAQFLTIEYDASSSGSEAPKAGTSASMVGNISRTIHNDEETESVVIYNYNNPTGVTVYGKTPTYFTDLGVESGDIIQIEYNSTTMIAKAVRMVWKKDGETLDNNTLRMGSNGAISDVRYCKLYKLWGPVADMFLANEDLSQVTTDDALVFRTDLFQIFKYNERLKTVESISADELVPYTVAGDSECSKVIVEVRYYEARSMFVVN